jgi:hypothetical protein
VVFTRDVAPILFANCVTCHRPGEVAPFPLMTYRDARKHGRQIVMVTESRFMPPWLPVSGYGEFEGARGLRDDERATLRRWYEEGMVEGDPQHLPPLPTFADGWQLGPPDLVLDMPQQYTLAAEGVDEIRNFVIPSPLSEARFVEAVELRPGNKRTVHHAVLKVDPTGWSRRLDEEDPEPGFPGMTMGNAEAPDGHIIVWTPGTTPLPSRAGLAWRLDPGVDLVLQLHMLPSGTVERFRARIGLHFADRPPERDTFAIVLRDDRIDIPAGMTGYTIEDSFTLPVPVDVLGIYPHAHYLGKQMRVTATPPGGSQQWLLRIDDWDFNWQGMYRYKEPLRLVAGTTIAMEFTYDNSASNVRNPNVPPRRVVSGNRSSDEMGNLALQVEPLRRSDLTLLREAQWLDMLEDDPFDSAAHFNLGVEYARRGMPTQAAAHYELVIRAKPHDQGAHFALAGTYVKLHDLPRAVTHYEQVLRINPRRAEAHFLLGWILADQGRLEQGAEHLEQAIDIAPDHALAHHRLGVVRAAQDDPLGAAMHYREALRLKPDLASARRDLQKLKR